MNIEVIEKGKNYEVATCIPEEGVLVKKFTSENANYIFDTKTGRMMLWGKTFKDDPDYFPAPNILDLEVTTKCNGGCKFCYKSNTTSGKNMTFDTFKRIFDVLPKSITQIAFGADRDLSSNPDLVIMMNYARKHNAILQLHMLQMKWQIFFQPCVELSPYQDMQIRMNAMTQLRN